MATSNPSPPSPYSSRRVIVAVSGTIQDGFELRPNIDYRDPDLTEDAVVEALFLGWAVIRGVKMYFDVKDEATSREYDPIAAPHRVNPAMVLTGNRLDANQYALYLVDERACLEALLGEPRLLTMAPDAVRIDLDDAGTSPEVAALARAMMTQYSSGEQCKNTKECAVLAVVACYQSKNFVPAPPKEVRRDGTRLTSFRDSLAKFAGIQPSEIAPGTHAWNASVSQALEQARMRIRDGSHSAPHPFDGVSSSAPDTTEVMVRDDSLYGTDKNCFRLSRRMGTDEFNEIARSAGLEVRAK